MRGTSGLYHMKEEIDIASGQALGQLMVLVLGLRPPPKDGKCLIRDYCEEFFVIHAAARRLLGCISTANCGGKCADVRRVAQKYLNPSEVQIIAVGDAAKVRAALEKYGVVVSSL